MIVKVLIWTLKAVTVVFAWAVAFLGALSALHGSGVIVFLGSAVAASGLGAAVGIVRSKSKDIMWRSYTLLAVASLLLLGVALPDGRRTAQGNVTCAVKEPGGFAAFRDKSWVTGSGTVTRVLADDRTPPCHQRFILSDGAGRTVLIAHNIDEWGRLADVKVGDVVAFKGEFVSNSEGGVVHWTHPDKSHRKPGGWLKRLKSVK